MDEIDRTILQHLQDDGRISNAELARKAGLAASTTLERVRRLEQKGIIEGYRAVLSPEKLGRPVQAMIAVRLDGHTQDAIADFERTVQELPEVTACYHLTGRFDYLLHVVLEDINCLRDLVGARLAGMPAVDRLETFLIMASVKSNGRLPVDPVAAVEDQP